MNEHNEGGMELNYFGDECYLHSLDTDINENQYISIWWAERIRA